MDVSVVFGKTCHPLIFLLLYFSKRKKVQQTKKPRKLSVSWLARLRAADAGLSSPGRERVEAPKKVMKKEIKLTIFAPGEGGGYLPLCRIFVYISADMPPPGNWNSSNWLGQIGLNSDNSNDSNHQVGINNKKGKIDLI